MIELNSVQTYFSIWEAEWYQYPLFGGNNTNRKRQRERWRRKYKYILHDLKCKSKYIANEETQKKCEQIRSGGNNTNKKQWAGLARRPLKRIRSGESSTSM